MGRGPSNTILKSAKNRRSRGLSIDSTLTLPPLPCHFKVPLKLIFLLQAYQTFMKDSAQLFGAPSPEAHKFAVDIFNFEKRIAEITPGLQYLADPIKVNNNMKVLK